MDGLDSHIPRVLRNGVLYDQDLDRFFLDLPLNGIRSRHSLRACGYDLVVWVRFLSDARGKGVWHADRTDVDAYHRARRRDDAPFRVSASSWNRAVASLAKLYAWGEREHLVSASPFLHRTVWRRGRGARSGQYVARNQAYEHAAKRSDVRFVELDSFRTFRDVGIRGLTGDGTARSGARDRNGTRNALFAELLVTTGLRLEEASFLLASELTGLQTSHARQHRFRLPAALTKGERGRTILLSDKLASQLGVYIAVERASAVAKFKVRDGWLQIERPILIRRPALGDNGLTLLEGRATVLDAITPDERGRIVICDDEGKPEEPAALWLSEVGQPVQPNSWEAIFARASRRCAEAGFPIRISPHQLRHSFAVHMLAMLIQQHMRADDGKSKGQIYREVVGDPLQQVQRLLGHASLATTYIYLDHLASRADTVDAAVEALLALLPSGPTA